MYERVRVFKRKINGVYLLVLRLSSATRSALVFVCLYKQCKILFSSTNSVGGPSQGLKGLELIHG